MLQSIKKCSFHINEYLLKFKNVVDRLASVGHMISNLDHVEATFIGLPEKYDTFMLFVNSTPDIYTMEDIDSLLLAQETRIEKHSKELDSD